MGASRQPEIISREHELNPIEDARQPGESTAKTVGHTREKVAQSLESATSALRSAAVQGINIAEGTTRPLSSSAEYARNYHPFGVAQCAVRQNHGFTFFPKMQLELSPVTRFMLRPNLEPVKNGLKRST